MHVFVSRNWAQKWKKCSTRNKEGNVANQMTPSRYKKRLIFCACLKTTQAITMKFGCVLENSMLNPSTVSEKMYLIIVQG